MAAQESLANLADSSAGRTDECDRKCGRQIDDLRFERQRSPQRCAILWAEVLVEYGKLASIRSLHQTVEVQLTLKCQYVPKVFKKSGSNGIY